MLICLVFSSLAFSCPPWILLPETTGRRILPPSAPRPCQASLGSPTTTTGTTTGSAFCDGFWLHWGHFSQFSSTAAKDARLPKRKSGAPVLFQKENNNHYEKSYKPSFRNYHYHDFGAVLSGTFTGEFTKAFPFLGDKGFGIDSSKSCSFKSNTLPLSCQLQELARSSYTSEPTCPQGWWLLSPRPVFWELPPVTKRTSPGCKAPLHSKNKQDFRNRMVCKQFFPRW